VGLAEIAATAAAELLDREFRSDAGIRSAVGKDIKTTADLAAEEIISKELNPSGLPLIGEESVATEEIPSGPYWLVDPLDGTMNFTRGFPSYCVSIALWIDRNPLFGVVFDCGSNSAYKGGPDWGAWCGQVPIRVSTTAEVGQAILGTGFPSHRDYGSESLKVFLKRIQRFKKIRMIGSAALSLAWVARGVFDAYAEEGIMAWDVAAGLALVLGAGGSASFVPGKKPWSFDVVATNDRKFF